MSINRTNLLRLVARHRKMLQALAGLAVSTNLFGLENVKLPAGCEVDSYADNKRLCPTNVANLEAIERCLRDQQRSTCKTRVEESGCTFLRLRKPGVGSAAAVNRPKTAYLATQDGRPRRRQRR